MIHEVMSRIEEIDKYIYEVIVPKYKGFDAAHREDHALTVIEQAMKLLDGMQAWTGSCDAADEWTVPVDREVLKMAAACHDLGLVTGRDRHHLDSGEIIRGDEKIFPDGDTVLHADDQLIIVCKTDNPVKTKDVLEHILG